MSRRSRVLLIIGVILLVGLIAGSRLLGVYVDWLWYGEVDARQVFTVQALTRLGLWASIGVLMAAVIGLNLWIAYRMRPVFVPVSGPDDPLARYRTVLAQRAKLFGIGIPVVIGVISGLAAQGDWQVFQLFAHSQPFGRTDPQFGHDIGFYTFELPFYRWILSWAFVAVALSFLGALAVHYICGGIRLGGRDEQLSVPARVQLAVLAGVFVLLKAVAYFLDRYDLLLSDRNNLFTGATYTDINALMPAKLILLCIALFCAAAFFAGAFLRNLQVPALALVLLVLSSILIGAAWPAVLEQFSVRPNVNQKEAEPISRNIAATKQAFGITDDKVDIQDYPGKTQLTPADVRADTGTIPNVRLLDPSVLPPTFTQLRQQYNFYGFPNKLDLDRYRGPDGKLQDYVVAARELNGRALTQNQGTWINRHLVYTHGNGFVSAPADRVDAALSENNTQGGYPVFSVSDVSNPNGGIPVSQPRIYYGELPNDYAIVGSEQGEPPREYDTDTQQYSYTGSGGVPIGGFANRLAFAAYYGERNILFNQAIGDQSKIIYKRNPRQRVQDVAPWLKVDGDAYPTVVDGRIKWIVDGYTTLDNYPYSQQTQFGRATSDSQTGAGVAGQPDEPVNYIRNSVKATVDAYDGSVNLYSVDDQDPVLKAWSSVFPGTVKPSSAISPELRSHFRYPEDLFKVQRELLARYHVDNPQEFYSQRTFWDVPADPTAGEGQPSPEQDKQPPYYVMAQAPDQRRATFQLTSALTTLRRNNIAAWVSASSDPQNYGKISVLRLPTEAQTPGPVQVQKQMMSTPQVTENRTLFNNPGVQAKFGNLLTLPVAGGLLYVEPVYIQPTDQNAFPQLARVLVQFGGKVGFAPTLSGALDQVFGPGAGGATGEQPAPQPSPPPQGDSAGKPQPGGQASPELSRAVQDISTALDRVRQSQQSGNFADMGSAYQQLADATQRFERAQGAQGAGS